MSAALSKTSFVPPQVTSEAVPALFIKGRGRTFVVDTTTGEILSGMEPDAAPLRTIDLRDSPYVGVDTAWPANARDPQELLDATQPWDWWPNLKIVASSRILKLLHSNTSPKAVMALNYLAENLTVRNHWFGQVADIVEALSLASRSTERALQELEEGGLIRRQVQGRAWPMKISVHPWYAWRGDLAPRSAALNQWLGLAIGAAP